jgi:hypothetical protein
VTEHTTVDFGRSGREGTLEKAPSSVTDEGGEGGDCSTDGIRNL